MCFTHRAREGKFNFFSPPPDSSALGRERQHLGRGCELAGGGCSRRREVDLAERSGLRGDVESEERSTLGAHGSDAHLTRVHLEGTRSAHRGYDCEKCTWRIWTRRTQDLEHQLVKPRQGFQRRRHDLQVSTPTANRIISSDCTRDNQDQLQMGRNMSGGDFRGRLDRVGFWARFSFVL